MDNAFLQFFFFFLIFGAWLPIVLVKFCSRIIEASFTFEHEYNGDQ